MLCFISIAVFFGEGGSHHESAGINENEHDTCGDMLYSSWKVEDSELSADRVKIRAEPGIICGFDLGVAAAVSRLLRTAPRGARSQKESDG